MNTEVLLWYCKPRRGDKMVETSLRGRPSFSTFLHSDTNFGRDGLTYYDYQRYLRSQKVALLQEKRAQTHIPGCRKVTLPTSRKVYQSKNRSPNHITSESASNSTKDLEIKSADEHSKQESIYVKKEHKTILTHSQPGSVGKDLSQSPVYAPLSQTGVTWRLDESKRIQTERFSRTFARNPRTIKSATARDCHTTWPSLEQQYHPPRPKTVPSVRDTKLQTSDNEGNDKKAIQVKKASSHEYEQPPVIRPEHQLIQRSAWSESDQVDNLESAEPSLFERDLEALAHAFTWDTTTQRAYDEVGWEERVCAQVPPPMNTIEQFPDPLSQRLTFRRYHSEPANWQTCGLEWDWVQTRTGSFPSGPLTVNFCTNANRTQQIPGYLGCIPNHDGMDNPSEDLRPALLIRSLKPRPTNITRRINIPGYTGHIHWTRTNSTPTKPQSWWSTSERNYRPLPNEDEISPFCRNGVFSKMITTVSPHNPFNKIEL